MQRYDVAIVGGGPAGLAAGRAAAASGADAVVLEKGVPREDRSEPGPDSTDAAGLLDYWVDIAGLDPDEIPEEVILQDIDRAEFIGPSESVVVDRTGMDGSYPHFGFTFDRVAMDDWLRERAETAGAIYRGETSVREVTSDLTGTPEHRLTLGDGSDLVADTLILADGPQRQVTNAVLDRYLPAGESITTYLGTRTANHIAYQEHRRLPADAFEPNSMKFWWGAIPGETAYPWIFPNDDGVARVGLTMPIGLTMADIDNPTDYWLVDPDDEELPSPQTYLERLLSRVYPAYEPADFELVEDRGKRRGTETYAISSTRPIDSPTAAGIAVVGGAMGATSAFHEGGDHVAIRTGAIAGELAARDRLKRYNDAWKDAIGAEVLRNVAFADLVSDYTPADWDRAFRMTRKLKATDTEGRVLSPRLSAGIRGLKLYAQYRLRKRRYRDGGYVQLPESAYTLS